MNGLIERGNRHVAEAARSMIHGESLPTRLWAEAVNTAVYTLNRVPIAGLEWISPFEALTGSPPPLHHIRKFGSKGFVHIPDGQRTKWQPKAKQILLVGYEEGPSGSVISYRMFDEETGQVSVKKHVSLEERPVPAGTEPLPGLDARSAQCALVPGSTRVYPGCTD